MFVLFSMSNVCVCELEARKFQTIFVKNFLSLEKSESSKIFCSLENRVNIFVVVLGPTHASMSTIENHHWNNAAALAASPLVLTLLLLLPLLFDLTIFFFSFSTYA